MSIVKAREKLQEALGEHYGVRTATMTYDNQLYTQQFRFVVSKPDGSEFVAFCTVKPSEDINHCIEEEAKALIQTYGA